MTLGASGINYMGNVAAEVLTLAMKGAQVPDYTGKVKVKVIGDVEFTLSNIKLSKFTIGQGKISTQPPDHGALTLSKIKTKIKLDWKVKQVSWPHVGFSGTAEADTAKTTAGVSAELFVAKEGHPQIKVAKAGVSLGKLQITVHGKGLPDWVLQFLVDLFKGNLVNKIQSTLGGILGGFAESFANDFLMSAPFIHQFPGDTDVYYLLTEDPVIKDALASSSHLGVFKSHSDPKDPAATPPTLPALPSSLPRMLRIEFSDFMINSGIAIFHEHNFFQHKYLPEDVPEGSPVQLNTKSFRAIAPGLYDKYPNQPLTMTAKTTAPPEGAISEPGFELVCAPAHAEFAVLDGSGNETPVFAVFMEIRGLLTYTIVKNSALLLHSEKLSASEMKLDYSNVGDVNVADLEKAWNFLMQGMVVPALNKYFDRQGGIPLPTPGTLELINPSAAYGSDHVAFFDADMQIKIS